MNKYLLITLMAVITFPACRHKKNVVQAATTNTPVEADVYRFIVSFYSIGAGPDVKAHNEFNAFIADYQKQHKVIIAMDTVYWGREGEVDYCLKLTELTKSEQQYFIANLKSALSDAKWVHYSENTPCKNKHN